MSVIYCEISYFLSFADERTRIGIMNIPDMEVPVNRDNLKGLAHLVISVGDKENVNDLQNDYAMSNMVLSVL